jgi:hypothetical protein
MPHQSTSATICAARDLVVLFVHLLATLARLAGPGGACSMAAESAFVSNSSKHDVCRGS